MDWLAFQSNYQSVAEQGIRDPLVSKEALCLFQVGGLSLSCSGSKAISPKLGLRPGSSHLVGGSMGNQVNAAA